MEKSFTFPCLDGRLMFSLMQIPNKEEALYTVRHILAVAGFERYQNDLIKLGFGIQYTLNTEKFPLHIMGVGFTKGRVYQIKAYYTFYIFKQKPEIKEFVVTGNNHELSMCAIKKVLRQLEMPDKDKQVNDIVNSMAEENFNLEFIGINIEKDKVPGLKLYFKPQNTQ